MKTVGVVAGCVLVLTGGGAAWAYWHLDHNIRGVDIDSALGDDRPPKPAPATPEPSATAPPAGALNILVLGSDSRSGSENSALGGGHSEGARSDTAMVVHLNSRPFGGDRRQHSPRHPRRAARVPTSSGGSTQAAYSAMFNSAYSVGGPVCAVKTVEKLTGVRMDHYLEIDFSGFASVVDALGGVDLTTTEDIDDDLSHLQLDAGHHHLDGKQALAFARTRHGVGDGSDLGRIKLQQQLVKALVEEVSGSGLLTDPARLYEVADALTGSLTTDTGLDSLGELQDLAGSLKGLSADEVKTVMMPVLPAPSDPNRVVADQPEAGKLWASLR